MDNLVSYNAVCLCSGATVYLVYPDMRFPQPKAYPTAIRRLRSYAVKAKCAHDIE